MAISDQDRRVLRALAGAREKHEELSELLVFYYDLYQVQFEAKADLPEPEVRDELAMRWRLVSCPFGFVVWKRDSSTPERRVGGLPIRPGP